MVMARFSVCSEPRRFINQFKNQAAVRLGDRSGQCVLVYRLVEETPN